MSAWSRVRLDECTEVVSGATPDTSEAGYWDGDICWATPKDLSELEGAYISDTPRKITRRGLESCAASVLPPGSVLFSSRAPIGHVAINTVPMATNQGFKSFVPDQRRVDPKFLYYWLRKNRPYLESLGNGATFKEVSKAVVSRIEIALPPLPEQRRIAQILYKADALRAKRRAALAQLDTLTQSIFLDMFSDPATNPKGWPVNALGALGDISTGKTPPTSNEGMFGGEIPFATPGDLDVKLASTQRTITTAGAGFTKIVRAGSALVGCIGNIGKMAKTPVATAFNQQINAVEWGQDVDDDYGIAALAFAVPQMLTLASSTTVPILNKTGFSKVTIPVPPLSMQRAFASRISAVGELTCVHRAQLELAGDLFGALQNRAFRGGL